MKPNSWSQVSLPLIVMISFALLAPALPAAAQSTAPAALSPKAAAAQGDDWNDSAVRFRTVEVDGLDVFYREAGDPNAPVMLLLHGFPASSFMYRHLIERLAGRFHVRRPTIPGSVIARRRRRRLFRIPSIASPGLSRNLPTRCASTNIPFTCRTSGVRWGFAWPAGVRKRFSP